MQGEIIRMQKYIGEQEQSLENHRERIRDTERNIAQQIEQNRILDAHIEKI
jgi:hypothetical protein